MNNYILKIKNISKIYHDISGEITAIDNLNLEIIDKEFISIVGPSGCGKSTLLSILANLENESSGSITFKKPLKVGYMLQKDSLFPWKTVYENCLIGLEITNNLNDTTKERVNRLLSTYGLGEFIDKYPNSLSGGMRQRVGCLL